MKKNFLLLVISLFFAIPLSAQWIFNDMESTVKDSMWVKTFNSTQKKAYLLMYDTALAHHGSKSMKTSWRLHATESYGGNDGYEFKFPRAKDSGYYAKQHLGQFKDSLTYWNFGSAKYISIWFNNLKKSTVGGGAVQMRMKLHDAGGNSNYWGGSTSDVEDWYFQSANVFDADPGWKQLIIPLKDNGLIAPDDKGFTCPGWSGTANNGKLDLDKIIGYTIEWTSGVLGGDSLASGEIVWEQFQLLDYAYNPVYMFNDFVKDTTNFRTTGAGGALGTGGITLSAEKVDTLVSPSALALDYKVNIAETWGGYANMVYNLPSGSIVQDLSANTAINMWVKVVKPLVSSSGKVENVMSLRFVLREGALTDAAAGGDEWYTRANVRLDSVGATMGWQMVTMPLTGLVGSWGEFAGAPYKGFYAVNGSDGVMNLDKIKQIKIEFSASKDAGEPNGATLVHSGKVLLSTLTPSGYRSTDKTPPVAVTGILATPGAFDNLLTWTDVANEPSSTYNVYFSEKKFTDGAADATVENLPPFNLPLGTQFADHVLRAPVTDQNVTYYYGVTATDAAGNVNKTTNVIGPITNKAKGVPTISKTAPVGFKADGTLTAGEWTAISPIVLNAFRNPATAHMAPNQALKDSLDLNVKTYIAMDSKNLYVAFDVVDDTVSVDTLATDYEQDCADIFIGLYDWRGKKHNSLTRGATPDYHLRFSLQRLYFDTPGGKVGLYPGVNYIWKKKSLTPGYVVEAMIPFSLFASIGGDSLFVPKEGMRIPLDIEIQDRDSKATRDCNLCYSTLNNDNSWQDMWRWTHTWVGTQWVTAVKENSVVPGTYSLEQNYPNPFNPSTTIKYSLATTGNVTLKIFDVLGREVSMLVNEVQVAGNHTAVLNASHLASGMYIYKLESGSFSSVKKMMFVK